MFCLQFIWGGIHCGYFNLPTVVTVMNCDDLIYLTFDFEASGLKTVCDYVPGKVSQPVEVGAVVLNPSVSSLTSDVFYARMRFDRERFLWDTESEKVHKISQADLEGEPTMKEVAEQLYQFLCDIAGHHQPKIKIIIQHRKDETWLRQLLAEAGIATSVDDVAEGEPCIDIFYQSVHVRSMMLTSWVTGRYGGCLRDGYENFGSAVDQYRLFCVDYEKYAHKALMDAAVTGATYLLATSAQSADPDYRRNRLIAQLETLSKAMG